MAKEFLDSIIVSGTCQATTFSGSGASLTNIPNGALVNSSVTIGSTNVALGATVTTLGGLNTVSATNLTGTLNTAAQPNVTSLGTLASLGVTGTVTAGGFSGPGTGLTGTAASLTAGAVSSISSAQVTGALGFTPYNATNPSGFISSISSAMVTTALGFTPYNSTNPSGFITSSASISGSSASCTGAAATVTSLSGHNVSELTNNSGYITSSSVPTAYGSTPAMNGTGSAGSSGNWARGDHVHPSDTSRLSDSGHTWATSGYVKFSDGLIIQWGRVAASTTSFSFPITFPNAVFSVVTNALSATYDSYGIGTITTSGTSGNYNLGVASCWIATGY
jgi:hypothetical protein